MIRVRTSRPGPCAVAVAALVAAACSEDHVLTATLSRTRYEGVVRVKTLPHAKVAVTGFERTQYADRNGEATFSTSARDILPTVVVTSRAESADPPEVTTVLQPWGVEDIGLVGVRVPDGSPRSRGPEPAPTHTTVRLDGPRDGWGAQDARVAFDSATIAATVVFRAREDAIITAAGTALRAQGPSRELRVGCRTFAAEMPLGGTITSAHFELPVRVGNARRTLTVDVPHRGAAAALDALASGTPLCAAEGGLPARAGPRENVWVHGPRNDWAFGAEGAKLADVDVVLIATPGERVGEKRCGPYADRPGGAGFLVTIALHATDVRAIDPRTGAVLASATLRAGKEDEVCPVVVRSNEIRDPREAYVGDLQAWARETVLPAPR